MEFLLHNNPQSWALQGCSVTILVILERDIKNSFKTFFFKLVLECLQAQGDVPPVNKLPKHWIIHTKFK